MAKVTGGASAATKWNDERASCVWSRFETNPDDLASGAGQAELAAVAVVAITAVVSLDF